MLFTDIFSITQFQIVLGTADKINKYCMMAGSKEQFALNLEKQFPRQKEAITKLIDTIAVRMRFEPVSSNGYKLAFAPIEDSVQPAHPRSLIRVFNGRSMGSQGSSGVKLRF